MTWTRVLLISLFAACSRGEAAFDPDSRVSSRTHRVLTILGARDPESVRYDPDQDAYFISMMNGFGSYKDNNGYIVRVPAAAPSGLTIFAGSGKNGVTLHAPKGMAIHGDTLWVADIDVLRGFDRRSGAPLRTLDFAAHRPTLLNDVAIGPDGRLYVTDTGIRMTELGVIAREGAVGRRRGARRRPDPRLELERLERARVRGGRTADAGD